MRQTRHRLHARTPATFKRRASATGKRRRVGVVFLLDQTHVRATSYDCTSGSDLEKRMLLITSTECRTIAEKKLAEASRDTRHRRQLTLPKAGFFSLVN